MREHQRYRQHEYDQSGAEQFAHISLLLSLLGTTFYGVTASDHRIPKDDAQ
jgi:hypothetical protein